jgi:HD-like signal output (HDOD) protein
MDENAAIKWRDVSNRRSSEDILNIFTEMLERSFSTCLVGQSERVTTACVQIGKELHLGKDELYSLSLAAKFHDIGLLGVPDELLKKKEPWTQDEELMIARHADQGGRLVAKAFPDFPDAAEGIWFHHERVDGKGPIGLKVNEIPIIAKIVSLVTQIEEMINGTPRQAPMSLAQVVETVKAMKNKKFDPNVVDIFFIQSEEFYNLLRREDLEIPATVGRKAGSASVPLKPAVIVPPAIKAAVRSMPVAVSVPASSPKVTARSVPAAGAVSTSVSKTAFQSSSVTNAPRHELAPIMTRGEVVQLIRKGLELKPFSVNVHNIMAVTQNPHCSADDVAKEVRLDQALSLRILKLSNSSVYTTGRPTQNIKAAISRVGVREVRNLVMALNVINYYEGQIAQYLDPQLFWEHSIGCGLIASALAKACRSKSSDEFFLSGIVHDVGRLVLIDHIPEKYTRVWQAAEEYDIPLHIAEQKMLTVDHTNILEQALGQWNFSREFILPLVSHHKPIVKIKALPREQIESAGVLAMASLLTHALMIGQSGNETISPLDEWVDMFALREEVLTQIERNIPEETSALKLTMISRSCSSDINEDAVSLLKSKLKIHLVPLCLSNRPWSDVFRMFFNKISDRLENEPANLAIVYLRDAREQKKLLAQVEEIEKKQASGLLPTLLFCEKAFDGIDKEWLNRRPHAVFVCPVRISKLVKTLELMFSKR